MKLKTQCQDLLAEFNGRKLEDIKKRSKIHNVAQGDGNIRAVICHGDIVKQYTTT